MAYQECNADQQVILPPQPLQAQKGRGAVSNMPGRFELYSTQDFDDGWSDWQDPEYDIVAQSTQVIEEQAKSILTRNASPDIPFNVSLNPYRGCEHGCIYCFARPTHSYLGLSPGLDFERQIIAKINAPELLRQELAKPSYRPEPIALGVNTDAYQPCERQLGITRRVLEVLQECEHPVGLITKASLIERDIELLAAMATKGQAVVTITITTLDHTVARTLEPRATAPLRRLKTIQRLTAAGIPVGVNIAPIIPFVTDSELEQVVEAAAEAGAISASYIILRLPWEVNPLFQQWLQAYFPQRMQRVMNCVRDMRGGKDYDANFGSRMRGEGVWADLIRQRFARVSKACGVDARATRFAQMDCSKFRKPITVPPVTPRVVKAEEQLELF